MSANSRGNSAGLPAFWRQAARQHGPAFRGWRVHVCAQHADGVPTDPLLAMIGSVLRSGGASVSHRSFADLLALRCSLQGRSLHDAARDKTVIVLRPEAELGRCGLNRYSKIDIDSVNLLWRPCCSLLRSALTFVVEGTRTWRT